ncbi:MAG: hypothetical protein NC093_07285 [Alistipes sp.]|nr:hypothetical protein [Alistipes sp.]
MNESTEETEDTVRKNTNFDFAEMILLFSKMAALVLIIIGGWIALDRVFDSLGNSMRYNSKASVSAGIITDKEIINGHTAGGAGVGYYDGKVGYSFNGNKSYVPTVYRIHISAEFEYDGETHQGSNHFDVSEDVYNSYSIGDYFDSKDLTGNSEQE